MKLKKQQIISKNLREKHQLAIKQQTSKLMSFSQLSANKTKSTKNPYIQKLCNTTSNKKKKIINQKQIEIPLNSQNKSTADSKRRASNNSLLMKNDLKSLITKKTTNKYTQNNIVSDILKNIQKNCQILKNILDKQLKDSHKRDSFESKRQSKHANSAVIKNKNQDLSQKAFIKKQKSQISSKIHKHSQKEISIKINQPFNYEQYFNKQISNKKMVNTSKKLNKIKQTKLSCKKIVDTKDANPQRSKKIQHNNTRFTNSYSLLTNSKGRSGLIDKYEKSTKSHERIQSLIKEQQKAVELNINIPEFSFKEHFENRSYMRERQQEDILQNNNCNQFNGVKDIQNITFQNLQKMGFVNNHAQTCIKLQWQEGKDINDQQGMESKDQIFYFSKIGKDKKSAHKFSNNQYFYQKQQLDKYQLQESQKLSELISDDKFIFRKNHALNLQVEECSSQNQIKHEDQNSLIGCQISILQNNVIEDSELSVFCL